MDLPLILAGPILRRVEPDLVTVWLALRDSCTLKLALWENQIEADDAQEDNLWFRSPDPGVKTIRVGDKLHLATVALQLPEAKKLVPERLYSYDLEITPDNQTTKETLKSLELLKNDPDNADPDGDNTKHLALGFEVGLLPSVVLCPKELTDLKLVHGSCRNPDTNFPDGLAWLDDLFTNEKVYKSAVKRPHQLFLTGDQIYADEVARPMLAMIGELAKTLFGATKEQLPLADQSQANKVASFDADLLNFPVGHRHTLMVNEAGMTTRAGAGHLMSLGEFCAMYLMVWNSAIWPEFPALEDLQLPANWETQVPPVVRDAVSKLNGEPVKFGEYGANQLERDIANLTEVRRTLPKVRRGLANVPTYMIFDDHEVTDDWYMSQTWRDRVLGSFLGSAIVRNGMLAYALFQAWGNDPLKFQEKAGQLEKQPGQQLLELTPQFLPAGAATGPDIVTEGNPAKKIEELLGLNLRSAQALDGSYAETDPPMKWFFTVPGEKHQVLVLDCRTRRSFVSRTSPPGNIGLTAQKEQIPEKPTPENKQWIVVSSLPLLGPPIFDELFAPLLVRAFDFKDRSELQSNRGTKRLDGTNPDAVEAWCFDPNLFEALLKRLLPYTPLILLSGDVHYSATNAMSYWTDKPEPARFVQFISSGLKNVMPAIIVFANRSFAFAQKMIRAKIGAERLAWEKSSSRTVTVPEGTNVRPRYRALLKKSPVLIPTIGWPEKATHEEPEWAWRVYPIRDTRADKDRPPLAQAFSLFPDDPTNKDNDLGKTDLDAYHRVAERHSRQLDRLPYSRQILFASSIAVITFLKKTEKDKNDQDVEITYAVQDLYAIQRDPANLITRPKPLIYTRHEVPLRDLTGDKPDFNPPKQQQ